VSSNNGLTESSNPAGEGVPIRPYAEGTARESASISPAIPPGPVDNAIGGRTTLESALIFPAAFPSLGGDQARRTNPAVDWMPPPPPRDTRGPRTVTEQLIAATNSLILPASFPSLGGCQAQGTFPIGARIPPPPLPWAPPMRYARRAMLALTPIPPAPRPGINPAWDWVAPPPASRIPGPRHTTEVIEEATNVLREEIRFGTSIHGVFPRAPPLADLFGGLT